MRACDTPLGELSAHALIDATETDAAALRASIYVKRVQLRAARF